MPKNRKRVISKFGIMIDSMSIVLYIIYIHIFKKLYYFDKIINFIKKKKFEFKNRKGC